MLDFDPEVAGIVSQPFWLHWHDGRRPRRHCPDYVVRRSDGTAMVIDVRAEDRIEPEDAEAFAAMEVACAQAGWRFGRLGAAGAVVTANVRWLSRYRHPRCAGPDGLAGAVMAAFDQPAALWDGAAAVGDRVAGLPVVFHLLWRHDLAAGLTARLGPSTLVCRGRRGGGPGADAVGPRARPPAAGGGRPRGGSPGSRARGGGGGWAGPTGGAAGG